MKFTLLPSFFDAGQKMGLFALTTAQKLVFKRKNALPLHRQNDQKDNIINHGGLKKRITLTQNSRPKERKVKKMKKIVLSMMLLMSMTVAMADNDNNEAANSAYEFNVNVYKLGSTLGFSSDQYTFMANVMEAFSDDMKLAGCASTEDRKGLTHMAIQRNLSAVRTLLTKKQYRKYLMLLNANLLNRGLR